MQIRKKKYRSVPLGRELNVRFCHRAVLSHGIQGVFHTAKVLVNVKPYCSARYFKGFCIFTDAIRLIDLIEHTQTRIVKMSAKGWER